MGFYILEEQLKLIEKNVKNLEKIDNVYEEVCLKAIDIDELAIRYINDNDKTYDICLKSVKKYGETLAYVPNEKRTEEICMEAVKQVGLAITYIYIENQTEKVCLMF